MNSLQESTIAFEKNTILVDLINILEDMTSDWEKAFAAKIGSETRLVADLTFASVDIVQLTVALEEHFKRPHLPFQALVMTADGRYVDDIRVSDLVDFLYTHLNKGSA